MNHWRRIAICLLLTWGGLAFAETPTIEELAKDSLPLRTALHHDPSLEAPLDQLVQMYASAQKLTALQDMYRAHLANYPDDSRATAVLIRLLAPYNPDEGLTLAEASATRFPQDGYLHYLLYRLRNAQGVEGDLEALAQAIELDQTALHRQDWLTELLPLAQSRQDDARVDAALTEMAKLQDGRPDGMLSTARLMTKYGRHEQALEQITAALALSPAPETMIDLQLAAVDALEAAGRRAEAATRVDDLLERLGPDYWRRSDIYRRRIGLIQSEAEREAMREKAQKRVEAEPHSEVAAIDLAELLTAFELRRQAADVLLEASHRIPDSEVIENSLIELYDRLRNWPAKADYLKARTAQFPERENLRFTYALVLARLNRHDEASEQIDALLEGKTAEQKTRLLLELVRLYRRQNLHAESADLLARVVAISPERLDVRRELAEIYLALGQRDKLAAAFDDALPEHADVTQVLDLADFLIANRNYLQARQLLRGALADSPVNLELRLKLAHVESRVDNRQAARELLLAARELADTEALYRRWLQAAVEFHAQHDTSDVFLQQERDRLDGETTTWSERQTARQLAFVETIGGEGSREQLAELLDQYLERELPVEVSVRLRERRLELIQATPQNKGLFVHHFRQLLADAPENADLYKARFAIFSLATNDRNQAITMLGETDPLKLNDPLVLSELVKVMESTGNTARLSLALRRLVDLDPGNLAYWDSWLLAMYDELDEIALRNLIRQLLSGSAQVELSNESRDLLRRQLVDSCWRSANVIMSEQSRENWGAILDLLSEAETSIRDDHQWLWVAWTRAYVLNAMGRTDARDAAIVELEEVSKRLRLAAAAEQAKADAEQAEANKTTAAKPAAATSAPASASAEVEEDPLPPDLLSFPDGLQVPLAEARKLLTTPLADSRFPAPSAAVGPLSDDLAVKWIYSADSPVQAIQVLPTGMVLISEARQFHAVDRATGRLHWVFGPIQQQNPFEDPCIFYPDGPSPMLFTSDGNIVIAIDAATGDTRWLAQANPKLEQGGQVRLHLWQDRLYAVDAIGLYVSVLDPLTGKVVAESNLAETLQAAGVTPPTRNAGHVVTFAGGAMIVNGSYCGMVDLETLAPIWMFDLARVRVVPNKLKNADVEADAPVNLSSSYGRSSRWGFHGNPSSSVRTESYIQMRSYSRGRQGQRRLVSPAGMWSMINFPGLIHGDSLVMPINNGLLVAHGTLPLTRQSVMVSGTYVGAAGPYLVTLDSMLRRTDLRTGEVRAIATPNARQACLDGNRVYLSTSDGISCLNVTTMEVIFHMPWPAAAKDLVSQDEQFSPGHFLGIRIQQRAQNPNQSNNTTAMQPILSKAVDGWLFALSASNTVVVLAQEDAP